MLAPVPMSQKLRPKHETVVIRHFISVQGAEVYDVGQTRSARVSGITVYTCSFVSKLRLKLTATEH